MRVVAGTAKGIRLGPVPRGVRPVADRAREGIFSSLASDVGGADVLDLFAGTGAMGIEALSRGARTCAFVDASPAAVAAVRDNLGRTALADRASVVRSEAGRFLKRARARGTRFDLCLLDPPYATPVARVGEIMEVLAEGLLARAWIVVLTRSRRSSTPVIPVDWRVARRLEYGDGLAIIYREV